MSFLDNLIKIDVKENMGIVGATDEFFCLFLNDLFAIYQIINTILSL